MAEIVRFRGEGGAVMLVEVDERSVGVEEDGDVGLIVDRRDGRIAEGTTQLEDSLRSVEGALVAFDEYGRGVARAGGWPGAE